MIQEHSQSQKNQALYPVSHHKPKPGTTHILLYAIRIEMKKTQNTSLFPLGKDSSVKVPHGTLWNVPSWMMLKFYDGECQYKPLEKGQDSDLDNCIAL